MFTLRRITTTPGSPLSIMVDAPPAQADGDGGFAMGGHYLFYPAGSEDGETSFQVPEHAARIIMGDPGLAPHFECSPPLESKSDRAADEPKPVARRSVARGTPDADSTM